MALRPEPDDLTPSQRIGRDVMKMELDVLEALRELAGHEMMLETVRRQTRPDPNDLYERVRAFRDAETKFNQIKTKLIELHKQAIAALAREQS